MSLVTCPLSSSVTHMRRNIKQGNIENSISQIWFLEPDLPALFFSFFFLFQDSPVAGPNLAGPPLFLGPKAHNTLPAGDIAVP